ncbi:MAG TPA: long-chain fatty acid--CoA ligase [Halieaceae bacterium]|nr:long-chain fatty acid--CoA ligase [Haliea sp.]HBX73181.1 long-chain fatty acid--CoA ligase [Halieaceae bacterium]|tara:strand:- start:10272 stop:11885 length:1614 start_codon:yes stop_codon:yes gene_type:complete
MQATMMHMPMTVRMIMEHGAAVFPESRVGVFDGEQTHWSSYRDVADQAGRLAGALAALGIGRGDRVATFSWNNPAHMEAYLAIPSMGAIMHTVNIRLSVEQVAWVINHAENRVVILDASLLELFLPVVPLLKTVEHILLVDGDAAEVGGIPASNYAQALAAQDARFPWPELEETAAAAVCYTSGTTGNPKGVVYSHKTTFVHSLASRATDTFGINERDRILLLPPMFHANAWGLPYSGWLSGSDFILPGPHLQAAGIEAMIRAEKPTFTATVPTILADLLRASRDTGLQMDSFRMLVCGGAAVAPALIDAARERWGVPVLQGWGMTETSPLCHLSHPPREPGPDGETPWRAKSGRPVPGVQVRVVDADGHELPHNGRDVGELQLRGPWITGTYHNNKAEDSFTADGWLRTGDVGHIDEKHFVQLTDRTKDVIKSGGEWISSVDLEGALLAHPAVREVAVIATDDERWQERPLAIVVAESEVAPAALRAFLADRVAKFWIPEYWSFVDEIPKTSVGKLDKKVLRARHAAGEYPVDYVK